MNDLTKKWKNKELRHGGYYVKVFTGAIIIDFFDAVPLKFMRCDEDDIDEVVAPVPSYEELQRLESDRLAKQEGEEIIAELENEVERLKEDICTGRCYNRCEAQDDNL